MTTKILNGSYSGGTTMATVGAASLAYAGLWTQTAGTLSANTGDKLTFTGVGNSFAGTLARAGAVAFSAGSDTLAGTTLKAKSVAIGAATVTLSGTISNASTVSLTSPSVLIAAAGASLAGSGTLSLSNTASNKITGATATATATLTNIDNNIKGAGLLGGGSMILVNQAGGLIDASQALSLTLDTGTSTITNAGILESGGAGGLIIASALNNTGKLEAVIGTLTAKGAVTGAGTGEIINGTAHFTAAFGEKGAFGTGGTGTLELGKSQSFVGSISGFSKTGANFLDLDDIAYAAATTKATYSGTTTSGVLTVTDGTHTAKITLSGDYTTSAFVLASDGHGGTLIHDPAGKVPVVHAFIAAMAGFGAVAGSGGAMVCMARDWRSGPTALAMPSQISP